jgi:Zn-dependent protease with chaperone function
MAIVVDNGQALAQLFAERMLNSVGEGIVIAVFAWLLLRLLSRQSSSTRFAVWFSALIAIAAVPIFEGLPPTSGLTIVGASPAFRLPGAWAVGIFAAWAVIASAGLARIALSFLRLRELRRKCDTIDPASLHPVLQETLKEFGARRRVEICTSLEVRVPAALGFIKPTIVFPAWTLKDLDPQEMNAILLHELAHLRRWDDWTNLAQQILRAVFFFHPGVWLIGRGLSAEREMACDDFVLAGTLDPAAYARCLVSVAEKTFLHRGLALALAVAGRVHQTTQRVTRILDVQRPKATKVWKPALSLVATFSALCFISLPRTPRLVEFEHDNSTATAPVAAHLHRSDAATAGARMIPAAFYGANHDSIVGQNSTPSSLQNAAPSLQASAKPLQALSRASASKLVSARSITGARGPRVVKVADRVATGVAATSQVAQRSVLLVMQTEQVDDSGNVVWSFAVWRLTVFHPADQVVRKEITPKST